MGSGKKVSKNGYSASQKALLGVGHSAAAEGLNCLRGGCHFLGGDLEILGVFGKHFARR